MKIIRKSNDEDREFSPMDRFPSVFRGAVGRFFDEDVWNPFHGRRFLRPFKGMGFPKVDISETENDITITANIPGVDPDKVEIEVSDDSISLSGKAEKEVEEKDNEKRFYRYEREYGEFRREFSLPARVKPDQVTAKAKDGVLTVTFPKTEEEKRKKIKIERE